MTAVSVDGMRDSLEPVGHTHGRFICKSEGTRLQGGGAEVGHFISQRPELESEIQMRTCGHIEAGAIHNHAFRLLWKTRRSAVRRNRGGACGVRHTISKWIRRSGRCAIVSWTKQNQASPALEKRLDISRLPEFVNVAAADLREVDRDRGNSACDRVLL